MGKRWKIEILDRCVRCGRCVRVCPSEVFARPQAEGPIEVLSPENCIGCGHCVAACPTDTVAHELFPRDCVHPVDRAQLPTPEQLLLLMRARRSNRDLTQKEIPEVWMHQILEAAHRAPTASNLQQVAFTVLRKPEELKAVIDYTLDYFRRMLRLIKLPLLGALIRRVVPAADRYAATFERIVREWEEEGRDRILRGATALILIHTPQSNRFGATDAQLAYQNGSLMAEALGVSQIYTGFLCMAIRGDRKGRLNRMLGIQGTIHAGMALGIPKNLYPNYIDRKPLQADWRK